MEGIKVIMAALAGVFLAAVLKSVKSEMTMLDRRPAYRY